MIKRFREVIPGVLYRGSAPSPKDVLELQDKLGIKKIVSLDQKAGDRINRVCKLLGITHVKLYIEYSRKDLLNFLSQDLKKVFLKGGPTFVHCHEGKDRTSLAIALVKCKYLNVRPDDAIAEAKSLGFGVGIPVSTTNLYEKIIRSCKKTSDQNSADIVSIEREYKGDNRDSFLDEGHQGSFAPYLDRTKQNPMDAVYYYLNDQSPTRENYQTDWQDKKNQIENDEQENSESIPLIGIYNNDAGIHGAGPAEPVGGFIYD